MSDSSQTIRIATRGSALALAQANTVLSHCQKTFPELRFELRIIKTTGDKLQTASLASANLPKGLFTKEIEEALAANDADLAVHSLKDLPTELPAGLKVGAVLARADVRDVLVCRDLEFMVNTVDTTKPVNQQRRAYRPFLSVEGLPGGATVATSSTRRSAQLLAHRPDLKIVPIRGNVGTRLKKLFEQSELDATILAAAGLDRLSFRISPTGELSGDDVPRGLAATRLPLAVMLPCVGQAAIGIEIRDQDERIAAICSKLNHAETWHSVTAERSFLAGMGGGCQLAVAAHAEMRNAELHMSAISFLGSQPKRAEDHAPPADAAELGLRLARTLGGTKA